MGHDVGDEGRVGSRGQVVAELDEEEGQDVEGERVEIGHPQQGQAIDDRAHEDEGASPSHAEAGPVADGPHKGWEDQSDEGSQTHDPGHARPLAGIAHHAQHLAGDGDDQQTAPQHAEGEPENVEADVIEDG